MLPEEPSLAHSALLIVDFQNDFLKPAAALRRLGLEALGPEERETLLTNCQRLLASGRKEGKPVIYVQTAFRADLADCFFSPVWRASLASAPPFLVEGSSGAAMPEEVRPQVSDCCLVKKGHSAFQFTYLDRLLGGLGVDTCLVSGFGGVLGSIDETVRQGAALGYDFVIVTDATFPLQSPHLKTLTNRAFLKDTQEVISLLKVERQSQRGQGDRALRPALVIVDMQNDSIHPEGANHRLGFSRITDQERELIIRNNVRLCEGMRGKGLPVLHVNATHRPDFTDSATANMSRRRRPVPPGATYRTEGTWGAESVDELKTQGDDYLLIKKGHSAFGFTPLHRVLRNRGANLCLITGGAITGCVSDTVRECVGLGYRTVVVSDATYPPNSPYLAALAHRADVKTTEEVLGQLRNYEQRRMS